MNVEVLLLITGIIGTVAFSISGALTAIENKLDIFGVIIIGVITACGGGMFRDIMLNREIAMFVEWWYPLISVGSALLIFIVLYFLKNLQWENSRVYKTTFNIVDSIGLGAFVVVGCAVANNLDKSVFEIVFYGVLTAVGGGLLRDIMVRKIPVIFRKHIYAIAAILASNVFYLLSLTACPPIVNVIVTVVFTVIIRYLAFHFEWSLPVINLKDNEIK